MLPSGNASCATTSSRNGVVDVIVSGGRNVRRRRLLGRLLGRCMGGRCDRSSRGISRVGSVKRQSPNRRQYSCRPSLVRQNSVQADVKTALDTVLWSDWVTSAPSSGADLIYVPARSSTAAGWDAHASCRKHYHRSI